MQRVSGNFSDAIIYSDMVEAAAISQVQTLCNQEFSSGSCIRMMPDIHVGKGCTIGTTMTFSDKICPSIVGVDGYCGMYVVKLKETRINLPELDSCIRKNIPAGFLQIRKKTHKFARGSRIEEIKAYIGD